MFLREFFKPKSINMLSEGGNLEIDNPNFDPAQPESPDNPKKLQAQEIQLAPTKISDEVQDRTHMVGVLKKLFLDINEKFTNTYKTPLFNTSLLNAEIKEFMAGSSKHFFDLLKPNPNFNPKEPESENNPKMVGISDEEFKKYKPFVGDIDIQCNQELQPQILDFLNSNVGVAIGDMTLLGKPSQGNEQYNTLWQIIDPPLRLQVDFEYGRYSPETQKPDEWTSFSHSASWEDIKQNIKGVFHKYIYRALAKAVPTEKYIAKLSGLGKKRAMAVFGGESGKEPITDYENPPSPFVDANFSFAVASKGGGGLRTKYKPIDPKYNLPQEIMGVPVLELIPSEESEYIQNLDQQFISFFGRAPEGNDRKLQNNFVGTLELMNKYLSDDAKRKTATDFFDILFEPGGQMITKDDPKRDYAIKFAAVDKMLEVLGLKDMSPQVEKMARDYEQDFLDVEAFKQANPTEKQPRSAMLKQRAAGNKLSEADEPAVKAQLRKGMPHLRNLKAADFLDLIDEIHDGNGKFKLENIPLNVKIDGFGGRFGKNAQGEPFMGTSRTEPRYKPGFLKHHQQKGTTDPEVLGRAKMFDDLFEEMMNAIKLVDNELGPEFLVDKQVSCEVLFLPFAQTTPEGKLKFVGIAYDQLPQGIQLALVPISIVTASTGEPIVNESEMIKQLTKLGGRGSVMFIDNSLTQEQGLDVTEIINPLENIEELKQLVSDTAGKRDRASLQLKKEIEEKLQPIKEKLEDAIINDPNIIGKDLLGQDYEGIVINSRLGPIKITSQQQRDVISAKNAAKTAARTEHPRENQNKTAVVAIGSFVGHRGHQELFNYTIDKAKELGGDPYLFISNTEGMDDPIPASVKVQTWHKLYPEYSKQISTVQQGGSLIQKIKHELINPLPGKPPRYDNVVIMVGADRAGLTMPAALMKAVNKFSGYEHVKVSLEVTPRDTGVSFSQLRNVLKDSNATTKSQLDMWTQAFDAKKLGAEWIKHLMELTQKGMGIQPQQPAKPQPATTQDLAEQYDRIKAMLIERIIQNELRRT